MEFTLSFHVSCCCILQRIRMKTLFCLFLSLGLVCIVSARKFNSPTTQDWDTYKAHHGKGYKGDAHEDRAQEHFMKNLKHINRHNKLYEEGKVSYKMELNKFADWSLEKMQARNGAKKPDGWLEEQRKKYRRKRNGKIVALADDEYSNLPPPPDSFDWRNKSGVNYISPAKDQGICGSCYSFSTVGAIESQFLIKGYAENTFSEQQIVACSPFNPMATEAAKNHTAKYNQLPTGGCHGGFAGYVLQYIMDVDGLARSDMYPYNLVNSKSPDSCKHVPRDGAVKVVRYENLHLRDDKTLMKLLVNKGPLIVDVNADNNYAKLSLYQAGGIFHNQVMDTDHSVLLVGYGTQLDDSGASTDYWIIKNSWGDNFGDNGIFLLDRSPTQNAGIIGTSSSITWVEIA